MCCILCIYYMSMKLLKKPQTNKSEVLINQNIGTGTEANQNEGLHYSIPPLQGFRL